MIGLAMRVAVVEIHVIGWIPAHMVRCHAALRSIPVHQPSSPGEHTLPYGEQHSNRQCRLDPGPCVRHRSTGASFNPARPIGPIDPNTRTNIHNLTMKMCTICMVASLGNHQSLQAGVGPGAFVVAPVGVRLLVVGMRRTKNMRVTRMRALRLTRMSLRCWMPGACTADRLVGLR